MKYLIALVAGMLGGAAAAAAVLYWNPFLASGASDPPAEGAWTLRYRFPADSTVALTHDGRRRLPFVPQDIPTLWEETLRGVMLNVLVLEDADGVPQGIASRVSVPSPETNLLLRGIIVADHWLVTAPGRGSLFVEAKNNVWPLVKDTLPVDYLDRQWRGATRYPVTVGPQRRGGGVVVGATGEWAALEGAAREVYDVTRYGPAGVEAMAGTLVLEIAERKEAPAPKGGAPDGVQP